MRIVDTSAWIEWLSKSAIGQAVRPHIPKPEDWIVPTIIQFELAKWAHREANLQDSRAIIAFATTCITLPLTTDVALLAADLSQQYKLSAADAIIYASALDQGADLITCDAHFEALPNVNYISKRLS